MTPAEGSSCQRRRPWRYDVGNAWWLLCHASPQVGIASQARLRDSSWVSKRWRPKKRQSELMLNVNWWHRNTRTAPPQSIAVSPPATVPVSATPSPNGTAIPAATHSRKVRSTARTTRSPSRSFA